MSEEINELKTNTQSVQKDERKFCTFTDYAIERFKPSSFEWLTKDGKQRDRRIYPLKGPTCFKGLRLNCFRTTGKKFFQLMYTVKTEQKGYEDKDGNPIQHFKYRSLPLTIGEFVPGKFGVKECRDKISEILKDHTDDKGRWIKDPKKTLEDKDKKVYDAEAIKLKKRSIREVIELIVKKNFPSNINDGSVVATTIKQLSLPMYGYNKRTLLMYHSDDNKGHGRIHFKGNKYYGIGKPENVEDLFKKFPPGHGIIETKKLSKYKNRLDEKSLYDHDLSKNLIEHLNTQIIRDYINEKDERSYSAKRNIKRLFTYIWNFANEEGLIPTPKDGSTPINPTRSITIKRPEEFDNVITKYNHARFEPEQLQAIWNSAVKQQSKYPFSSMAILMYMVTGIRPNTINKIKKEYYQDKDKRKDFITLPSSIVKTKKDQNITITPPVKWILDNVEELLKQKKYQKYNFVPWLFPSTKVKSKQLYDDEYIKTDGTRLKDVRGCWNAICEDTGIEGSIKMFRKSFISMSKIVLKDSFKVMFLSGHTKEATIDIHYNKSTTEQQKQYANEVSDKVFNFHK